jgi:hypothetical protein
MCVRSGFDGGVGVTRAGRKFNWVDVTLETYEATDCSQFASGPVSFYDMKLVVRLTIFLFCS